MPTNKLVAQVLPVDSAQIQDASSVVSNITKPIVAHKGQFLPLLDGWKEAFINFGIRVALAILLFFLGRWLIGYIRRFIMGIMLRRKLEGVAVSLINSLIVAGLYLALGIGIASTLGIQSVSFAAVLASMGLAIGMALSGQLQNLAGGVIIVVTKPFSIGNYIQAQGVEGVVKSVSLFHSVISTVENKTVYIPNGSLSSGVIVNFNEANTRRIEWIIGIDYASDVDKAIALLEKLVLEDERILQEPSHFVAIKMLNASSIDLVVRAWVRTEDYVTTLHDFNRSVLLTFTQAGINFPFPQMTISKRQD